MILVRDVYQAKYGRGNELTALLKTAPLPAGYSARLLADASGTFYTIVAEVAVESLSAYEQAREQVFGSPAFAPWFERMMPLVESGRREFFYIID